MALQPKSRVKRLGEAVPIVLLLPLVVPLALIGFILFLANRLVLNGLVRLWWLPRRKDILLIYSDSPIWLDYMTGEILPLVDRAIVLNWSQRRKWSRWSLAVRLFRSYAGGRDFNPMVILFRPLQRAKLFRFLPALEERKHGNHAPVEQLRQNLIHCLQLFP